MWQYSIIYRNGQSERSDWASFNDTRAEYEFRKDTDVSKDIAYIQMNDIDGNVVHQHMVDHVNN
jgi:hypothetical protein